MRERRVKREGDRGRERERERERVGGPSGRGKAERKRQRRRFLCRESACAREKSRKRKKKKKGRETWRRASGDVALAKAASFFFSPIIASFRALFFLSSSLHAWCKRSGIAIWAKERDRRARKGTTQRESKESACLLFGVGFLVALAPPPPPSSRASTLEIGASISREDARHLGFSTHQAEDLLS